MLTFVVLTNRTLPRGCLLPSWHASSCSWSEPDMKLQTSEKLHQTNDCTTTRKVEMLEANLAKLRGGHNEFTPQQTQQNTTYQAYRVSLRVIVTIHSCIFQLDGIRPFSPPSIPSQVMAPNVTSAAQKPLRSSRPENDSLRAQNAASLLNGSTDLWEKTPWTDLKNGMDGGWEAPLKWICSCGPAASSTLPITKSTPNIWNYGPAFFWPYLTINIRGELPQAVFYPWI